MPETASPFQNPARTTIASLLLDADSLRIMQNRLGWILDIEKLVHLLRATYEVPRLVYFATINPEITEAQNKYHSWLKYRGFDLILHPETQTWLPPSRESITTPIPVEIAVEATARPDQPSQVILLSRNRDLEAVGLTLRRSHRTLTLISDADCPRSLRCAATHFVDLASLRPQLARPQRTASADHA